MKTCLHCTCVFVSYLNNESKGWSSSSYPQFPKAQASLMPFCSVFSLLIHVFHPEGKPSADAFAYIKCKDHMKCNCKTQSKSVKSPLYILKRCHKYVPVTSLTNLLMSVTSDTSSSLHHVCAQTLSPLLVSPATPVCSQQHFCVVLYLFSML